MRMWDAVILDLGGVVLDSPLQSFARFEREHGLPAQLINRLVVSGGAAGPWARFECGELPWEEFLAAFAAQAQAMQVDLDVAALMAELEVSTDIRPEVTARIERLRTRGYRTAALTNNWASPDQEQKVNALRPLFDVVVESFRVGLRKPDPAIYQLVVEQLRVEPSKAVFIDDIGFNLKPARAMGMHTIKASDEAGVLAALDELLST